LSQDGLHIAYIKNRIEAQIITTEKHAPPVTSTLKADGVNKPQNSTAQIVVNAHNLEAMPSNSDSGGREGLEEWIKNQCLTEGFNDNGFLGKHLLKTKLVAMQPNQESEIRSTMNR
jgi:hypothetical protein